MAAPLAPFNLPARYRLEGGIAAGGMAAVYAAHDTLLDRPVAVKVLAEHLNEDEAARRRFQREARAAAALSSHPSVVTIFDVGEHEGRSYIVMELRSGGTVGEQLTAGPVDPARAIGWLRAAADALDAGHERGVVHRDIKPANLLLDEHDRLAVADFGIARLAYESEQVTMTGQVLGTAAYISPEQAVGESATAASDLYALAAVAFELLTGTKPFTAENFAAQARAHIEDPVPSASKRNPRLPRGVDAVLRRGLAKEAGDRWPSAGAFVDALEQALDGDETAATRAMGAGAAPLAEPGDTPRRPLAAMAPASAAPAPPAAPPPADPRSEDAPGRRGRLPGLVLAALALLLVGGAALAIALGGGNGGDSGSSSTGDGNGSGKTAKEEAKADRTATPEAKEDEATPEPTSTAASTPEATATPEQTAAASGGSPTELNDRGWALYQQGRYEEAVPLFREALDGCGDSGALVCQYVLFNLGSSLHRSGSSAEGIPYLQQRLERFPENQASTVQAELDAACAQAGQDCASGEDSSGQGRGRGRGKGKGKG